MMRQLRQAIGRDDQSLVFDRLSLLCADLASQLVALAWFGVLQPWREGFAACLNFALTIIYLGGHSFSGMYQGDPWREYCNVIALPRIPPARYLGSGNVLANKKATAQSAVAKIFRTYIKIRKHYSHLKRDAFHFSKSLAFLEMLHVGQRI